MGLALKKSVVDFILNLIGYIELRPLCPITCSANFSNATKLKSIKAWCTGGVANCFSFLKRKKLDFLSVKTEFER